MKSLIYFMIAGMVMGLAFWAYHQNYQTQTVLKETRALHGEIGALRERLSVLRAEWAYLNRPDRLRDLADLNFERLQLFPLSPEQFAKADQIAQPQAPDLDGALSARGTR